MLAEMTYSNETERCCALLEAVLKGLGASNCQAVADRPDWEIEMAKPSGSGEEGQFAMLLERVEQHYRLLSERVTGLDQKVERGLRDVHRDMDIGFGDLRKGIAGLVSELREHSHT